MRAHVVVPLALLLALVGGALAQTRNTLNFGLPVTQSFTGTGAGSFAFQTPNPAGSNAQVFLTSISGFPQLCVSSSGSTCDLGNSLDGLSSSALVPGRSSPINVDVTCYFGCNFTVTAILQATDAADAASTNSKFVELVPNVPQYSASVYSNGQSPKPLFFQFQVQASRGITFTLTPTTGAMQLLVGASSSAFPVASDAASYAYSSNANLQSGAVSLILTDSQVAANTHFRLAVVPNATSFAVQFTITASFNGQSSSVLPLNSVITDAVAANDYEYWVAYVPNVNSATVTCNLTVTVTPQSGDPDLYVSQTLQFPTAGSCTLTNCKFSQASGADSVTYLSPASGAYYIGVRAFSATSSYALYAAYTCSDRVTAIPLTEGQPVNGHVDARTVKYYSFLLQDPLLDLTISLTRRAGDPDLYVSNTVQNPGPGTSYTWASVARGSDFLTISHTDAKWNCVQNRLCNFTIGVFGALSDADYTIAVSTVRNSVRLLDGITFSETIGVAQSEYFYFYVFDHTQDIFVSVTALGRGDPDLFVSVDTAQPGPTSWQWQASSMAGDSLTIRHDAPLIKDRALPFPVFIAVRAATPVDFTVVAAMHAPVDLALGLPQSGIVTNGEVKYYRLSVSPQSVSAVTVSLAVASGAGSLYISNTESPKPGNASTYQWSSLYFDPNRRITIDVTSASLRRDDSGLVPLYIGVFGASSLTQPLTNYTLLAFSAASTVALQPGVSVTRSLAAGAFSYFSVRVNSPGLDMAIVVTPITGDPDLYVSRNNTQPSPNDYEWRAMNFGADLIPIGNAPVGTYYIGVKAFLNSTFRIVVQLTDPTADDNAYNNMVYLHDGEPQQGYVFQNNIQYYGFSLPFNSSQLIVSLVQQLGDPDVYISKTVNPCSPARSLLTVCPNAQWRSFAIGADTVTIDRPEPGFYFLAVHGWSTSTFTITVTARGSSVLLQNGIPVRGDAPQGGYDYFWLPVDSPDQDLTISITALSGDPDLYISKSLFLPNASAYDWAALHIGGDAITIPHTDPKFCYGCNYYIAVSGYSNCSYIITASFSRALRLQDGQPQQGSVGAGGIKYYQFYAFNPHSDITIALTPLSGNPNLYVSASAEVYPLPSDRTTYSWSSTNWFSGENLVIHYTDPSFCVSQLSFGTPTRCVYTVAVVGATQSSYSIQMTTSASQLWLRDGVPVRDWLPSGGADYFSYTVVRSEPAGYLSLAVTPFSGDPDLFVSRTVQLPNATANTWSANRFGGDAIYIPSPELGTYYIGVRGFLNTSFTLLAQYHPGNDSSVTTSLVNGVPQEDVVPQGRWRYYLLQLNMPHDLLVVTLLRSAGDPDLYVARGRLPTRADFDANSLSAGGQDLVTLRGSQADTYYIGIYGWTGNLSHYTLMAATSDAIVTLVDGNPVRGVVNRDSYQYYQIYIDQVQEKWDLTVSLTLLFGDADLYVSDLYQRPNRTHYSYMSNSVGGDSITIPASTLRSRFYYIAVYGYQNASFSLSASFSNATRVLAGMPASATVNYHAVKYFIFDDYNLHSSLTFTLTTPVGTAALFVSVTEEPVPGQIATYQWSSQRWGAVQQVIVPDLQGCGILPSTLSFCRYFIGVLGTRALANNQTTQFTLMVTSNASLVTLQDGVPLSDVALGRNWAYYQISVPTSPAVLAVSVTALSGDPDLFVSTQNRPNFTSFQWRSMAWGADTVVIDSTTDSNFRVGTYYIGIYSFTDTAYTVTANVLYPNEDLNARIRLINGQPQMGLLEANAMRYYSIYVPYDPDSEHLELALTLTPRYGDADMFVRDDNRLPLPSFYQWKSDNTGRDELHIPLDRSDKTYTIGVRGFSRTLYTLTATYGDAVITLQSGVSMQARVVAGRITYFQIAAPNDAELLVSVQDLGGGDPDLGVTFGALPNLVNTTGSSVPRLNASYVANMYGSDSIFLATTRRGFYYIGVYGFMNSTFVVTATVETVGAFHTLLDGKPQLGFVPFGEARLYAFQVEDATRSLDVSLALQVQSGIGQLSFYVYADCTPDAFPDEGIPAAGNAQWSSVSTNNAAARNTVTIASSDPNACFNGTYLIGVYASGNPGGATPAPNTKLGMQFTFTASTRVITLAAGQPFLGGVAQNKYKYFRITNDRINQDLRITLSTFSGNADLYASLTDEYPNASSFQFKSDNADTTGDYLVIPHTSFSRSFQTVYIAVRGKAESFFSIVVTNHFLELLEGYGQNAWVPADAANPLFLNFQVSKLAHNAITFSFNPPGSTVLPPQPPMLTTYVSSVKADMEISLLPECAYQPTQACYARYAPGVSNLLSIVKFDFQLGASIAIDAQSPVFCEECVYYLGVSAAQLFAVPVVVTASTANSVIALTSSQNRRMDQVAAGQYQYYELFFDSASLYTVLLEPCTGNPDIYGSQSTFTPSETDFTWSSDKQGEIDGFQLSQANSRATVHVGVYGRDRPSVFYVSFVNQTTLAQYPQPGAMANRRTQLTVNSPDKGAAEVTFYRAALPGHADDAGLEYKVHWALANEDTVFTSKCGMSLFQADHGDAAPLKTDGNTLSTVVRGLRDGQEYIFNVVVLNSATQYYAVYTQSSGITIGKSGGLALLAWLIPAAITVVVVLAGAVGWLFYRNRKLTQELDIEMQDVPKQAVLKATRGPVASDSTKRTEKYSALLQDGVMDEDDFSTDYSAPSVIVGDAEAPEGHISRMSESDRAAMLANAV